MLATRKSIAFLLTVATLTTVWRTFGASYAETNLLHLSKARFANDLTEAEEALFKTAAIGGSARWVSTAGENDDPSKSMSWGKQRVIRADRLAWLCTEPAAFSLVTTRGITVVGARIEGALALNFSILSFPVTLAKCAFTDDIMFVRCRFGGLYLNGSHIQGLEASGLEVEYDIYLNDGFKADGEVRLPRAKIHGDLNCSGAQFVNTNGVALNVQGATIGGYVFFLGGTTNIGELRLQDISVGNDLHFIDLRIANTKGPALSLDRAKIGGNIVLENARAEGEVRLPGANIAGQLSCSGGIFVHANGVAFGADQARIASGVFLTNVKANGQVRLVGALIGGGIFCTGGQFLNTNGTVFAIDASQVQGSVHLDRGFRAEGEVRLSGANIEGQVACNGGQFVNPRGAALMCDGGRFQTVLLANARFEGEVRLIDARIEDRLDCTAARFLNTNGIAIAAEGMRVGGNTYLRSAYVQGSLLLGNANINGNLNLDGGHFSYPQRVVVDCEAARITGVVSFRKTQFSGEVRLTRTTLGHLDCTAAHFVNTNATTCRADEATIEHSVLLEDAKFEGAILLSGANIGGNLDCSRGQFLNDGRIALSAAQTKIGGSVFLRDRIYAEGKVSFRAAKVNGDFVWWDIRTPGKVILDLRSAVVGTLSDQPASWPKSGDVLLDGFTYERIEADAPLQAEARIDWLRRQPADRLFPQPYEQLALVLRNMGHDEEATEVMIEKSRARAQRTPWSSPSRWWDTFFGIAARFGYDPWRAFWLSWIVIAIGCILFRTGKRHGLLVAAEPSKEKEDREAYPKFNAFIYSLETFLPLVQLGVAAHWQPNANAGWRAHAFKLKFARTGSLLRGYYWVHVVLGWFLTSFWIAGLTGLLKTE